MAEEESEMVSATEEQTETAPVTETAPENTETNTEEEVEKHQIRFKIHDFSLTFRPKSLRNAWI